MAATIISPIVDGAYQSGCHTASVWDNKSKANIPRLMQFMNDFGLITARDPEGKYHAMTDVIHKVLNDITIDDWAIIIGGDSHTRMSKGVAFGADSGTVALALATGEASMPIPQSVKVTFKGEMKNYMDFRDVVHATQSQMLSQFGGDNVFQGRVIEVHIGTLTADQAFTFTDWTAEMKAKASICISEDDTLIESLEIAKGRIQIMIDKGMDNQKQVLQGLIDIAQADTTDTVMAAIVGASGLLPTMAAVKSGKRVLLANKEALVMAGGLFMQAVAASGSVLLPIDSEHNAIFQCLPSDFKNTDKGGVKKLLLSASGGPFRGRTLEQMRAVTPDQACAHPNWSMGRKISVDSATLMNKGLELIEACWLFNVAASQVEVVVHPQSIIHSLVQYIDGSVLAQLGNPDMRTPIAHALAWPSRIESGVADLDLFSIVQLNFEKPDLTSFPCLAVASAAAREGRDAAAILNAANEIAVQAFLDERIGFTQIAEVVSHTLNSLALTEPDSLEAVQESDRRGRAVSSDYITRVQR